MSSFTCIIWQYLYTSNLCNKIKCNGKINEINLAVIINNNNKNSTSN
jgi:hypothetical protein